MKISKLLLFLVFVFQSSIVFSQQNKPIQNLKVFGIVIDKIDKQRLEYVTITLTDAASKKVIAGGISNKKGEFEINLVPSVYDINIAFISYTPINFKNRTITETTNLGTIPLEVDVKQLNEVVIRSEKSSVEVKLDKKVYNVGQDMIVKGGTVIDVLDNVPSLAVDSEGNISLRGNENVRILIDGRPSNAINISEALRQLPADAIDKVEVITNPSARYDAEGGAGLINIILKKGKNQGFNGSFLASLGFPETYGLSSNLNYKTKNLNYFTTTGYGRTTIQGGGKANSRFFDTNNGLSTGFLNENRDSERARDGFNSRFGLEWTLSPNTFWINAINYQNDEGINKDKIQFDNFDSNLNYTGTRFRFGNGTTKGENVEYTSNFIKNFNDKGHKLTVDGAISRNTDTAQSRISDANVIDNTNNNQIQKQFVLQADYVLPLKKGNQFEAGFKASFVDLNNQYAILKNQQIRLDYLSNTLEYLENIIALYTQYGFKKNKFSYLFGLRWENTRIEVNLLETNNFNPKNYAKFFPSAFVNYEISNKSNVSASYSKRISRPRGRYMNPAINYASNINFFQGNPELDPSITNKFDFGYTIRLKTITFSTSAYFEDITDVFSFVRSPTGDDVNGIPVIRISPINVGKEQRLGYEFTLNYSPFKIWRLNSNFNFYSVKNIGNNTYFNSKGVLVVQNLDNQALTWFTRMSSKLTLPSKIDWQLNATFNGDQKTAQGKSIGMFAMNTAFSKDVLKEKGTISFSVSDVFNHRIMRSYTYFLNQTTYGELQFRKRQFIVSFTYRFNKPKTEKLKNSSPKYEEGGGDF